MDLKTVVSVVVFVLVLWPIGGLGTFIWVKYWKETVERLLLRLLQPIGFAGIPDPNTRELVNYVFWKFWLVLLLALLGALCLLIDWLRTLPGKGEKAIGDWIVARRARKAVVQLGPDSPPPVAEPVSPDPSARPDGGVMGDRHPDPDGGVHGDPHDGQ